MATTPFGVIERMRERVVAAFESLPEMDLGGFKLKLGPKDHQASDFVDLTFLGAQRWGP